MAKKTTSRKRPARGVATKKATKKPRGKKKLAVKPATVARTRRAKISRLLAEADRRYGGMFKRLADL